MSGFGIVGRARLLRRRLPRRKKHLEAIFRSSRIAGLSNNQWRTRCVGLALVVDISAC